jgi:hypothetical protein
MMTMTMMGMMGMMMMMDDTRIVAVGKCYQAPTLHPSSGGASIVPRSTSLEPVAAVLVDLANHPPVVSSSSRYHRNPSLVRESIIVRETITSSTTARR